MGTYVAHILGNSTHITHVCSELPHVYPIHRMSQKYLPRTSVAPIGKFDAHKCSIHTSSFCAATNSRVLSLLCTVADVPDTHDVCLLTRGHRHRCDGHPRCGAVQAVARHLRASIHADHVLHLRVGALRCAASVGMFFICMTTSCSMLLPPAFV